MDGPKTFQVKIEPTTVSIPPNSNVTHVSGSPKSTVPFLSSNASLPSFAVPDTIKVKPKPPLPPNLYDRPAPITVVPKEAKKLLQSPSFRYAPVKFHTSAPTNIAILPTLMPFARPIILVGTLSISNNKFAIFHPPKAAATAATTGNKSSLILLFISSVCCWIPSKIDSSHREPTSKPSKPPPEPEPLPLPLLLCGLMTFSSSMPVVAFFSSLSASVVLFTDSVAPSAEPLMLLPKSTFCISTPKKLAAAMMASPIRSINACNHGITLTRTDKKTEPKV